MRKLIALLHVGFLAALFVATVIFAKYNATPVSLCLGSRCWEPLPLAVWVLGAFMIGSVIGLLVGLRLFHWLRGQIELMRVRQRLRDAEAEITRLRTLPFRDAGSP